jgi:hypothetical protein
LFSEPLATTIKNRGEALSIVSSNAVAVRAVWVKGIRHTELPPVHGEPGEWRAKRTLSDPSAVRSTGVTDAKEAEAIRARREWEIIQRSVFGPEATATFVGAAVSYLEAGGETLYLKPIIAKIGSVPLAKIDQAQ